MIDVYENAGLCRALGGFVAATQQGKAEATADGLCRWLEQPGNGDTFLAILKRELEYQTHPLGGWFQLADNLNAQATEDVRVGIDRGGKQIPEGGADKAQ